MNGYPLLAARRWQQSLEPPDAFLLASAARPGRSARPTSNPFQVVCALCLALLVERPTRFVDIFRASFLLPMTVSIALTSILWSIMLDSTLGPVNGFLRWAGLPAQRFFRSPDQALGTLIVVATWKGAGYWMVFLLAGLLSIPKELYESAAIDGATGWPGTTPSRRHRR